MRAPSTSDVRQRPSTTAELPVDGRDDQLTSGGRAAALSYLLRSRDPLPLAFPRGFDSIEPLLDGRMRKSRAHAPMQSASSGGDHGSNARGKGCSYLRCVLCADRGGTETPLTSKLAL